MGEPSGSTTLGTFYAFCCVLQQHLFRGALPRLQTFLQPFLDTLKTSPQQINAHHYVQQLRSELGSKYIESIAYLHDRERQGLQKFFGQDDGPSRPLLTELARQAGHALSRPPTFLPAGSFGPGLSHTILPAPGTPDGLRAKWFYRSFVLTATPSADEPGIIDDVPLAAKPALRILDCNAIQVEGGRQLIEMMPSISASPA